MTTVTTATTSATITATTIATTTVATSAAGATINTDSFEAVYTYLQPAMLRCVRAALTRAGAGARGDSSDLTANGISPEDITQQAWLQVWRTWSTLRGRDLQLITTYAMRVARNLVIDQQRRWQVSERNGQVTLSPDVWEAVTERLAPNTRRADQPEAALLDAETLTEAVALTRRLTATDRKSIAVPLLASLLADETPTEIAARLGVTPNAAKTAAWRLRRLLRSHLADAADKTRDEVSA